MTKKTTAGVLVGAGALLLIYELAVLFGGPDNALISPVVYGAATKYPPITFGLGFLFGHLLWPQRIK